MWRYLRKHEAMVRRALGGEPEAAALEALLAYHRVQIAHMQHERLIHLIVTMFCGLFLLLVLGFATVRPTWPAGAMALLLLGLEGAYLVHYFRLENGVQRWYGLENELLRRLGRVSNT